MKNRPTPFRLSPISAVTTALLLGGCSVIKPFDYNHPSLTPDEINAVVAKQRAIVEAGVQVRIDKAQMAADAALVNTLHQRADHNPSCSWRALYDAGVYGVLNKYPDVGSVAPDIEAARGFEKTGLPFVLSDCSGGQYVSASTDASVSPEVATRHNSVTLEVPRSAVHIVKQSVVRVAAKVSAPFFQPPVITDTPYSVPFMGQSILSPSNPDNVRVTLPPGTWNGSQLIFADTGKPLHISVNSDAATPHSTTPTLVPPPSPTELTIKPVPKPTVASPSNPPLSTIAPHSPATGKGWFSNHLCLPLLLIGGIGGVAIYGPRYWSKRRNQLEQRRIFNRNRFSLNKVASIATWKNIRTVAPEMLLGMGSSYGTKALLTFGAKTILAKFALAAAVTTLPGLAVFVGSAIVLGASAGGVSRVVRAAYRNRKGGPTEKNWVLREFGRGALWGGIGGAVGATVINALSSEGFLHQLFSHHSPAATHALRPVIVDTTFHSVRMPMKLELPQPYTHPVVTSAPTAPVQIVTVPHASVSIFDASKLLSPDQMKLLSPTLLKMGASNKSEDVIDFCKEASYRLINRSHGNAAARQAGVSLMKRALDIAQKSNIHSAIVTKLYEDMSYVDNWGIGTTQNIAEAKEYAVRAGTAFAKHFVPAPVVNYTPG